jgi:hypothetical protein
MTPALNIPHTSTVPDASLPRWRTRDVLSVLLLAIVFFILLRPTFHDPFYWDSSYAADTATRLLQGSLNPHMRGFADPGHPVLIPELYAVGWLVLRGTPVWWPHCVAFMLCFLTLLYSYRIGAWLGGPLLGLAGALLIMIDPLFLAQSGATYLAAPSVGLATATLYYLLTEQPGKFAIAGSLAALTYIPTDIFLGCLIAIAVLLHLRKGARAVIWYLVPGLTLAAWLLFHRFAYGYFLSDPNFWKFGQRSASLSIGHLRINLEDVFLRQWRLPFTILAFAGGLLLVLFMLMGRRSAKDSIARRVYERLGGRNAALLFLVLLVGTFFYLPIVTATTGVILLGRYFLVLIVPLFLLAVRMLQASRVTWLWILLCLALGWNLRAHWYDRKEPWRGNLEESLLYRRVIRAEVAAANYLSTQFPSASILAGFPHSAELTLPSLAYVQRALRVERAVTAGPATPVDLVYYSSVTPADDKQRLFQAIDRQGARPIQSFGQGDVKIVLLKTGENLDVPQNRYNAVLLSSPLQVPINHVFDVSAAFQNLGRNPWAAAAVPWDLHADIAVGYQWERDGAMLPGGDALRIPLQHDYLWGETAVVSLLVHAPSQPGRYVLILDLVGPGDAWFAQSGNAPIRVDMEVSPLGR